MYGIPKLQAIKSELGEQVHIMLASKNQSEQQLRLFLENGHRLFGENRVQEAAEKWPRLLTAYPKCQLHLIGPLQTNKAKQALQLFDVIQSLDRPKLANKLAILEQELPPRQYYLQVNIGREPQKSGVMPEELEELYKYCKQLKLNVTGLMCIPPAGEDSTPYFVQMRKLCDDLELANLSMGMSADYKQAARSGSTMVRLGSIIFGGR